VIAHDPVQNAAARIAPRVRGRDTNHPAGNAACVLGRDRAADRTFPPMTMAGRSDSA
jgi:hypothetical protein